MRLTFDANFTVVRNMMLIRTAPSAHGIGEYSIPLSFLLSLSWSAEILKQPLTPPNTSIKLAFIPPKCHPLLFLPNSNRQRVALSHKVVPGIPHPLLLSFLAGKFAFKHIYKDDDSLYDAIKSTPVFAKILADLEDDSVFVLYNVLKSLEKELSPALCLDIAKASKNMKTSLTMLQSDKRLTRFIGNHSYLATLMIILSRGQA